MIQQQRGELALVGGMPGLATPSSVARSREQPVRATSPTAVSRLWSAHRRPDFRSLMTGRLTPFTHQGRKAVAIYRIYEQPVVEYGISVGDGPRSVPSTATRSTGAQSWHQRWGRSRRLARSTRRGGGQFGLGSPPTAHAKTTTDVGSSDPGRHQPPHAKTTTDVGSSGSGRRRAPHARAAGRLGWGNWHGGGWAVGLEVAGMAGNGGREGEVGFSEVALRCWRRGVHYLSWGGGWPGELAGGRKRALRELPGQRRICGSW
jgi:hypothetical protein